VVRKVYVDHKCVKRFILYLEEYTQFERPQCRHGDDIQMNRKWIVRDSVKISVVFSAIFLWSSSTTLSLKKSPINLQLNLIIHPSYYS